MTQIPSDKLVLPVQSWQHTGAAAGWSLSAEPDATGDGFHFRLGRQSQFADELLLRLLLAPPGQMGTDPFTHFNPLADANWLVSLIDSWAAMGDVLSFYQERNANEGYVSSAVQQVSRRLLLSSVAPPRAVSVSPRTSAAHASGASVPTSLLPQGSNVIERLDTPAAAAEIFAALTMSTGALKPDLSEIAAGTEITLHRVRDGQIAAFTTTSPLAAIVGVSQMRPAPVGSASQVDLPVGATAVVLAEAPGLKTGQQLFLRSTAQGSDGLPVHWRIVTLTSVEKALSGQGVLITWTGPADAPAIPDVQIWTLGAPYAPFGKLAPRLADAPAAEKVRTVNQGGVMICDHATGKWRSHNTGLPNADLADIALSRDGTIYLATSRGIYVTSDRGDAPFLAENAGLRSRDVTSFARGTDGMVYCSGTNGLVARTEDPQQGWSLILGNRSLVPPPQDSKGAIYTALPRTLVRQVRVGPVIDDTQPHFFTYALLGEGVFANGMTGDGWRLSNPPEPGSKASAGVAVKSGRNFRDFLVFGDGGQASILAATDTHLIHYTTNGGPSDETRKKRKKSWLQRFLDWILPCRPKDPTAAALPALGKWIDLHGRAPTALAFVDWPKDRRQLLLATSKGVFAYHASTDGLQLLDQGAPSGVPSALSVPDKPLSPGSFGLSDTLVAVATFPCGFYALTVDIAKWTDEAMPSGTWHKIQDFVPAAPAAADNDSSVRASAPMVGSTDPARTTALPQVSPRAAFAADGTLIAIAPLGIPDQWPGLSLASDSLDLLPTAPVIRPGEPLVLAQEGAPDCTTLATATASEITVQSGFGLPPRQVQSVALSPNRSGPDPARYPLRDVSIRAMSRALTPLAIPPVTDTILSGAALTLANPPAAGFAARHIGVFGKAARALLPATGGISAISCGSGEQPKRSAATCAGSDVISITGQATSGTPILAALARGGTGGPGGIMRSTDNGQSWTAVAMPWKGDVLDIARWPGKAAFVLTTHAVYRSDAGGTGAHWTRFADLPKAQPLARVWSGPDGAAYASGPDCGLWRLEPARGKWSRVTGGALTAKADVIALCWGTGNRAYLSVAELGAMVGTLSGNSSSGAFLRLDLPGVGTQIDGLAFDDTRQALLVASLKSGLHVWSERHRTCQRQSLPGKRADAFDRIVVVPGANPAAPMWLTSGPGVLQITADGGRHWTPIALGPDNAPRAIAPLAAAPGGKATVVALLGTRSGTVLWSDRDRPSHAAPARMGALTDAAVAWLDQSVIPATLRQQFKKTGCPLPTGTRVQVLSPGQSWLIAAQSNPAATDPARKPGAGRMASHQPARVAAETPAAAGATSDPTYILVLRNCLPATGLTLLNAFSLSSVTRQGASGLSAVTAAGQKMTLDAVPEDLILLPPSDQDTEISEVAHGTLDPSGNLRLSAPLTQSFAVSSTVLNANLCHAVEGRYHHDVTLGPPPAALGFISLPLPDPPLVFLRGPTRGTRRAALHVTVQGHPWTEVADLSSAGPRDRVYQLDVSADGAATLVFGDGRHGQRPSTEHGAIRASYLSGRTVPAAPSVSVAGSPTSGPGLPTDPVGPGQKVLATLNHVPNGISPVVASIWDKPEIPADIVTSRRTLPGNLPRRLTGSNRLLNDREISRFVTSLEDIAACAVLTLRRNGFQPLVGIALGGTDGRALANDAAPVSGLAAEIEAMLPSPAPRVQTLSAQIRHFRYAAEVWLDGSRSQQSVQSGLQQAVDRQFGWRNQPLGTAIQLDGVLACLQSVPGVAGVVLTALYPSGAPARLETVLPATKLHYDSHAHQFIAPVWWLPDADPDGADFVFEQRVEALNG